MQQYRKKKKVLYIGNFGDFKTLSGSQVKKTVSIFNYLISNGVNVIKFNSNNLKTLFFPFYFILLIFKLYANQDVIVSLNRNGLKIGKSLLLKVITKINKGKSLYITIGGWLPEFLAENSDIIIYLKKFDKIYVQADEIVKRLDKIGLQNTENIKNFRDFDSSIIEVFRKKITSINYSSKKEIKLVFFAFNRKEKGLSDLAYAVNNFNKTNSCTKYKVDIYGPVEKKYNKEFFSLIEEISELEYKGILTDQTEIYKVLNSYDLMAFPSYYQGEGFPTVIVEAFISGLPVLASRWKYNEEIITHEYNGLLFNVRNRDDLLIKLQWISLNKDKIAKMRLNCLDDAMNYSPEKILYPVLKNVRGD